MTKGEKGMGETLRSVAKKCQNDAIQTQMNKIKKEFLGKKVLGVPESAMQELSMWLMKKSRKVVSVSTSMKDECASLPKPKLQLEQLHDDDVGVFATSLIDRYAARPVSLQNICLATFAVTYDVIQSSTYKEETEGVNAEEEMQNTENDNSLTKMKLQKGLGVIRKRKQEAILHTRRYKICAETEKYYHSKLLLYYPWNHEDDIILTFTTYHESYMSKKDIIHQNAKKNSMKTVQHLTWTCKIWKTIYYSLHGRWLLQISHRMIEQQMCKVSAHCRMSNKKKKIP